ncbi:MAG: hypothetical protein HYY37_05135 [Candidatus Aenigmarchaeota archaeon]|nr:hypothetical protein [Candidatus Aenigmarchaeota archaeon]
MHQLEIFAYFPHGMPKGRINYRQKHTVTLPVDGPATVDIIEDGTKREITVPFPVYSVDAPLTFAHAYRAERERRRSPSYNPNELVANLCVFRPDEDSVYWEENMTDWATIAGVLRPGMVASLPGKERSRFLRLLAPIAPLGIVESSDGYLALGVRGRIHLEGKILPFPAGHPVYDAAQQKMETPFQALERLAYTEMGFQLESDVKKAMYCIGAVRGTSIPGSWVPAVPFIVESSWTARQLYEGYETAAARYENRRFMRLPIDRKQLTALIENDCRNIVDNGLAALLLYGRFRFGETWYEERCQDLTKTYHATIVETNPFNEFQAGFF